MELPFIVKFIEWYDIRMIKDEIREFWKTEFSKMSIDSSDIDKVFDRICKKVLTNIHSSLMC